MLLSFRVTLICGLSKERKLSSASHSRDTLFFFCMHLKLAPDSVTLVPKLRAELTSYLFPGTILISVAPNYSWWDEKRDDKDRTSPEMITGFLGTSLHFEQARVYQKCHQNAAPEVWGPELCSCFLPSCSAAVRFVHGCILPCGTKEICVGLVTELRQMPPWPCDWSDWLTLQMQGKWAGCIFCFRHQLTTGIIFLPTRVRNKRRKSSSVGNTAWGRVTGRETAYLGVDRYLLSCFPSTIYVKIPLLLCKDTSFSVLFAVIKMIIFPMCSCSI